MNRIEKWFSFWFMQVSRGYSLPMSLTNWLVVFILGFINGGNLLNGVLALIGFAFAHMGTNVFDDFVDHLTGVPKQECKTAHIDNGQTNLKTILILAIVYFAIALCIGIFLFVKCGWFVLALAGIGGFIALCYPFLNKFALGELAVGMTFGPLLFAGVYFVMTGNITKQVLAISVPVAIFTVAVLMVHALMDYDFDKVSGKKTLCILAGSKIAALNMIFALIVLAFALTLWFIGIEYLPIMSACTLGLFLVVITLYKRLGIYITEEKHEKSSFRNNFALIRDLGTIYCVFIALSLYLNWFIDFEKDRLEFLRNINNYDMLIK